MPYNTTAIPPRKEITGQAQLPLTRVKKLIALDPDVAACSSNAAFVITLATEMFIQYLAEQGHIVVKSERKPRRNIQYKDLAAAIARLDNLEFLSDVVPRTVTYKQLKDKKNRGETSTGKVEVGQTTLDGKNPDDVLINGHEIKSRAEDNMDDDIGNFDPNAQLEMEIRRARPQNGSLYDGNAWTQDRDVEMS